MITVENAYRKKKATDYYLKAFQDNSIIKHMDFIKQKTEVLNAIRLFQFYKESLLKASEKNQQILVSIKSKNCLKLTSTVN